MLDIKIGKKWKIKSVKECYIICEKYIVKKKIVWKEICYYNKFRNLIDKLIELDLRYSDCKSLKEVKEHVENFKNEIKENITLELYNSEIEFDPTIKMSIRKKRKK
jgi:hypothetical protein